jgi:hypothetical protein
MRRIAPLSARRNIALVAVLAPVVFAACADQVTDPAPNARPSLQVQDASASPSLTILGDASGGPEAFLASVNVAVAGQGFAVRGADLLLASTADPSFKSTVLAHDRQHRLGFQFVAGDPRRMTVGDIVRQATFLPFRVAPTASGTLVDAKPSIDASFATWNGVNCSKLTVVNNALPANVFPSAILGLGGGFVNNSLLSDINTVGFLPGFIFDLVFGPGASGSILGVTFPFVWIDAAGNPTDINADGDDDLAFAEIWYNAAFPWTVTGSGGVDIETVALHENGHALGLGHFGKISIKNKGQLKASPRAVMNALYAGPLRSPLGTDNGSFCGYWASWPN